MKRISLQQFEGFIIPFIILAIVSISLSPVLYTNSQTPTDNFYTGINRWSEDYYIYLSIIQLGKRGAWSVSWSQSTYPHSPTLVHEEYLLMGHFAHLFNLTSSFTYHFFRFILGTLLLSVSYLFLRSFLSFKRSLLAFISAFLIGSFPNFSDLMNFFNGRLPFLKISYPLSWLLELDVVRRSTIVPHYQLASIFFILIIFFFLKTYNSPHPKNIIFLSLSSFFLAVIQPVSLLILFSSVGIFYLINFISSLLKNREESKLLLLPILKRYFLSAFFLFIPAFLAVGYYLYAFSLPLWKSLLSNSANTPYPITASNLLFALGPTFLLALLGIAIFIFRKESLSKKSELLLLLCWLLSHGLIFFIVTKFIHFEKIRSLFPPYYVPLGVFSMLFLDYCTSFFNKAKKRVFVELFLFFLVFFLTLPSIVSSLRNQVFEYTDYQTFSQFVFPSKEQISAFSYLENNSQYSDRVLSLYEANFLIPAFSGNPIFTGINYDQIDPSFKQKQQQRDQFLLGLMKENTAKQFLSENHIKFIYYGYQEKSLGGDLHGYTFLEPIYVNPQVTIYNVL